MVISTLLLKLTLALLAVYHLGIGLFSVLSHRWTAKVTHGLYAIHLDDHPQFHYAVKMLGLFALTFGFLLCLPVIDPYEYREIILAAILLQGLRALFRGFYNPMVTSAFKVQTFRNLANAGILVAEVAILVVCFPRGPI